jgi:hypothetical protein
MATARDEKIQKCKQFKIQSTIEKIEEQSRNMEKKKNQ